MESFEPFTLRLRGRLLELKRPAVMGILNVTPDSFYSLSRQQSSREIAVCVETMVTQGVDIIDVGACSTRPGSDSVDADEELRRLQLALPVVREVAPELPVSVDTWRSSIARECVEALGADIVNDVGSLILDPAMVATVAELGVPYVLTHSRGCAATMQQLTDYGERGVTATVIGELSSRYDALRLAGVADVIIDPGLGFAKTPAQCFELLRELPVLRRAFHCSLLVGLSRKSMLTKPLGIGADEALPATVAANTLALMQGAAILRVHDVAAARQASDVFNLFSTNNQA